MDGNEDYLQRGRWTSVYHPCVASLCICWREDGVSWRGDSPAWYNTCTHLGISVLVISVLMSVTQ